MENKYVVAFAQNLKEFIGEMSISEFSRKVDIPQQTISRYLLCQREISLSNLIKIADFFGEEIDYLIGRKEYWKRQISRKKAAHEEFRTPLLLFTFFTFPKGIRTA